MLSRYIQTDNLKINNKVIVYLIVFFILLPISKVYNLSTHDLQIFSNSISKLLLLLILILCSVTRNYQISLAIAIFYTYVCILNQHHQVNLRSKK